MLDSYSLQSGFGNGDSERQRDSRSYSLLPSLSSQGSAQAVSEKKTVTQIHRPSGSLQQLLALHLYPHKRCGREQTWLWRRRHLDSPWSPVFRTPAVLSLTSHTGLLIIHDSALLLNHLVFVYFHRHTIMKHSLERKHYSKRAGMCVFFFILLMQIRPCYSKRRKELRRLGFLSHWGNTKAPFSGIQTGERRWDLLVVH